MLLNIEKVLDKGEVALISCSNDGKMLQDIQNTYFKATFKKELMDIATATMMIKCPLFVQLNLSKFDFNIINVAIDNIEVYIPDISEIEAKTVEDKRRIYKYFDQTMNALILNARSLPIDGCDPFIAQTTMPISTYSKLIVNGSLTTWIKFLKQVKLPKPVESYRLKIKDILGANWTNLRGLAKM
jgi:hypothetical protein